MCRKSVGFVFGESVLNVSVVCFFSESFVFS